MIVTKQYQKPNGNKLLSKLEDPNNGFILEKIRFSTTKLPITTYEIGPTSSGMKIYFHDTVWKLLKFSITIFFSMSFFFQNAKFQKLVTPNARIKSMFQNVDLIKEIVAWQKLTNLNVIPVNAISISFLHLILVSDLTLKTLKHTYSQILIFQIVRFEMFGQLEMDIAKMKWITILAILMEETVAIQNFFTTKCKFSNVKHGSNHEMPFKMGIFSFE